MGNIWAPNAFCVTFKLETDQNIVEKRSYISMIKNDIHIVVGNILIKRYEWVLMLENNFNIRDVNCDYVKNISGRKIKLIGIPRNFIEINSNNSSIINTLEHSLISYLVEKHLKYIDKYFKPTN